MHRSLKQQNVAWLNDYPRNRSLSNCKFNNRQCGIKAAAPMRRRRRKHWACRPWPAPGASSIGIFTRLQAPLEQVAMPNRHTMFTPGDLTGMFPLRKQQLRRSMGKPLTVGKPRQSGRTASSPAKPKGGMPAAGVGAPRDHI